jgi:hypothetical protein
MESRASRFLAVAALVAAGAFGCSSVGSSAVRTDGAWTPKHRGAVRIYALTPPNGVRVIGMVEVHAVNQEANIETLMPVFMKRVADIGGTGGVVDHVFTHYELRTEYRTESYAIPCGYRSTCWQTRIVPYQYQVRVLSIQGRALLPIDAPGPPAIEEKPAAPPATKPTEPTTSPPRPSGDKQGGTPI